ncbi:hypothetical protein KA005_04215 [bacterium]|nr:hypothetical protein [bacterium]
MLKRELVISNFTADNKPDYATGYNHENAKKRGADDESSKDYPGGFNNRFLVNY